MPMPWAPLGLAAEPAVALVVVVPAALHAASEATVAVPTLPAVVGPVEERKWQRKERARGQRGKGMKEGGKGGMAK